MTAFLADPVSKRHDPGPGHPESPARFDAVVIGCGQPAPDDLSCARLLRELAPQRPILLAGSMLEISEHELEAAGVAEILSKPLIEAEIAAALARGIAGSRQQDRSEPQTMA